jgi:hypothetical protein
MSDTLVNPADDPQDKSESTASTSLNPLLIKLSNNYARRKINRAELKQSIQANKLLSDNKIDRWIEVLTIALNLPSDEEANPAPDTPEVKNGPTSTSPIDNSGGNVPPPDPPPSTAQANPDQPDRRFGDTWIGFVRSIRTLTLDSVASLPRFTDQFRQWASRILTIAESTSVVDALQQAYNSTDHEVRESLLIEYQAFNQAVEVARQTEPGEKWPAARKIMLGIGATAIESLKDIFEEFLKNNPYLKGAIILFSEVLKVFRGD